MDKILKRLDKYADIGYNVLLVGDSGVGKTAMIEEVFNKKFKHWRYFNGATMNPWVDFVGVPDRTIDPESGNTYLTLVQQKDFATDQVEAIFMDELNRAKEKTRNAIMELLQFKSINGKKFNNLKLIWAAINEGEEYDVERLDRATKDRFQVELDIPYEPSQTFFVNKYEKLGEQALIWWHGMGEEQKKMVSPRRLEYAIKQFQHGLPLRDVLKGIKGYNQLKNLLESSSPLDKARLVYSRGEINKARELIKKNTFFDSLFMKEEILKMMINEQGESWLRFWIPMVPYENFIRLLNSSRTSRQFILNPSNIMTFKETLLDYYKVNRGKTALGEKLEEQMRINMEFNRYMQDNFIEE